MKHKLKNIVANLNPTKWYVTSVLMATSTLSAYASTTPPDGAAQNLGDVANNINGIVGNAVTAVKAVAMVAGLVLLITGIMQFKQGANDMQGTGGHHKKGLVAIVVGTCLLLAPTVLAILEMSLFNTSNQALS